MANTPQERELIWLTQKVKTDTALIKMAEAYVKEHRTKWSLGVLDHFFHMLEEMKDQLHFKEHRLELLAWKIVMERDEQTTSPRGIHQHGAPRL